MGDHDKKGYTVEIPDEAVKDALHSVVRRAQSKVSSADGSAGEIGQAIEIPVEIEPAEDEADSPRRRGPSRQELTAALQKSRDEAKAARDKMLRALADADNQRKRLVKEKQEIIKYNQEGLLRDLLIPLDNLERTLEHIPEGNGNPAIESLREGVTMVLRQFEETLTKHSLQGFSALGQKFDPALHEAIQSVESPDVEPGTVIAEMHRGYKLHDRLLRPALVTVACRVGESDAADGGDQVRKAPETEEAKAEDDNPDLQDE
ncbi:MAG TPA: nucleotide exchange factor GrpE [Myxococcota bacterium]|nr:nucleotide exchange factor GrpE [Myxococcota bacterium]